MRYFPLVLALFCYGNGAWGQVLIEDDLHDLNSNLTDIQREHGLRAVAKIKDVLRVAPEKPVGFSAKKLTTEPYRGKQDDIFFLNPDLGWYVNGAGKIYKTTDGGTTWVKLFEKPGTYFRCIVFEDETHGYAGNIGTDYFPGVTDTNPLYETTDGGTTWNPVKIPGNPVKGLCAFDILRVPFINAGRLDNKVTIYAAGRVGGPTCFLKTTDGKTWTASELPKECAMVLDVKFHDEKNGMLCAATSGNIADSNALILTTEDGGKTWTKRYQSNRLFEATWKASFPTRKTGYVTIQNYNPEQQSAQRYVAKTTDGGKKWVEIPLTSEAGAQEFGIGFLDENTGVVGTLTKGFMTTDGGQTWTSAPIGRAVNKIRWLPTKTGFVGYAIGVDVFKVEYTARPK